MLEKIRFMPKVEIYMIVFYCLSIILAILLSYIIFVYFEMGYSVNDIEFY